MTQVTIIGGGISGLSAAYSLCKAGMPSALIESRGRLGGVIQTENIDGCVVEGGPDSFLSVKPAAMELIRELGLAGEVIGSNDHLRKTYVLKGGRLVPLPDGLMFMVPTKVVPMLTSNLLSWSTKIRMAMEWFRRPRLNAGDISVADFVREHYGEEAVEYLAEPLLSGIYGGSPESLSIRSVLPRFVEMEAKYGSLTKGVLAERAAAKSETGKLPLFRTLRGGLGQLVDALGNAISGSTHVHFGHAERIERSTGGFRVRINESWCETKTLVVACEAHRAAALTENLDARLSELLAAVPYSSSMTVALGFREGSFTRPLDGFGFLVPKRERKRLVACTWVGTKFPDRVPPGVTLLRCFLGGTDGSAVLNESDEAIIRAVRSELGEIVGLTAEALFSRVYRWPQSMAQYTVGHQERMAGIAERLAQFPGLFLAGNAYQGIGIPDCIRMGRTTAERILASRGITT
jgi:oxygen-dependent protoporphyrinogen oxidase